MRYNGPQLRANGTIGPALFCSLDATADNMVLQTALGTSVVVGVSQVGMKRAPGLPGSDPTIAAQAGDQIELFIIGDTCLLTAGAAVTRGALLKSDASGRGIAGVTAGTDEIGALALQSASGAGVQIAVIVQCRKF